MSRSLVSLTNRNEKSCNFYSCFAFHLFSSLCAATMKPKNAKSTETSPALLSQGLITPNPTK
jgi:hypothetical protein